jgi:Protein of unknown function (DUF1800)
MHDWSPPMEATDATVPATPRAAEQTRPPARRALLAGAGLAAGATLFPTFAERADAAVASAKGAELLSTPSRHLVGRFAYGVTPALARQVRRQGGARRWFDRQLSPQGVADHDASALVTWYPGLSWSPGRLWKETTMGGLPGWSVMADYQCWVLLRRMYSNRQLLETMTEFWENHLYVPVYGDGVYTWRKRFGDVIRKHALDSFENLLWASTTHPAMGIYLDNAVSDKDHPNENLGRELLELHTVGVGNYTESDVKSSARILTGWKVDVWNTWAATYDPTAHWVGHVKVGSFSASNRSSDGRKVTRDYLRYLAHHPDTARRIATKLATVFVHDDPPKSLVDHLAQVYRAHDTQIRPVLSALVETKAFKDAVGAKIRDPQGDFVATYRALGVDVKKPHDRDKAAHQITWVASNIGQGVFEWPRPDGQPLDGASWASPSRMMGSMSFHYGSAGGWWPSQGIHYRQPLSWLPKDTTPFKVLVEHLSQQILHRHATDDLLKACCQAVDAKPMDQIDKDHPVMRWLFQRLMTTLLDSPAHFRR